MLMIPALVALAHFTQAPAPQPIPAESKAHYEARMAWWRKARFGMFLHWGLYSIPAGKWGDNDGYAEWIREEAHIPVHEYEKFQPEFNPVKFDPNLWASMAKDAGMKYVVLTTKHHDGFNMFFSKYTDWSVEHSPIHRDIARELANAVRKQGLTMGFYHSIMDWHHPDYLPRRSWEVADRPADGADFDRFVKYLRNDVDQLLTEYGPIGVMWFDGEWESTWNANYGDPLYALCRQLQPNVIVNNRVSVGRGGIADAGRVAGDYGTPEQTIPATGIPGQYWETCMTMNDHWGYNAADTHWKSTKTLVRNLIDIASKGGNYLLNIGPRSDGTFPPEAVERLHGIGQWMHVNGQAIYDTDASVFETLTWGRCTTKRQGSKTTLYLHVFDWPSDGLLVVPGLGNRILDAHVLGQNAGLAVDRGDSDVVVHLPKSPSNEIATVVALEIAGAPVVYKAPTIETDSTILVDSTRARITAPSVGLTVRFTLDGSVPTQNSTLYQSPISIGDTEVLKAASFAGTKRVSAVVSQEFTKVSPSPAADVTGLQPGLTCEIYHGTWDSMPDFASLMSDGKTTATAFTIPMANGKPVESIGQRYSGYITAAADGVYRFELTSDDGSKLWIDHRLVVDNDGLHSTETKAGTAALAKGLHKIVVGWFNNTGAASLGLKFGMIGQPLHVPTVDDLAHSE